MTADVVDIHTRRPVGQAEPATAARIVLVTAICGSLVHGRMCGGPLGYERGTWRHPRSIAGCTEPEPAMCEHRCGQPADIDQQCAHGDMFCDGCCWEREDLLEGRRLWPTIW